MPAFVWLDGEKDGAIVDGGFLRLFMMGVRLSVMIEYECTNTLTATFGPLGLSTCLRCLRFVLQIAHVLTLMRRFLAFFSADSLMRHPVLDLCK